VIRSERLIKQGDSWFFTKSVQVDFFNNVKFYKNIKKGRANFFIKGRFKHLTDIQKNSKFF